MPKYSVTPVLFAAACPTMTPLVVSMPDETAVSLTSTDGDACVRSGSSKAPTARETFMIMIDSLKRLVGGEDNQEPNMEKLITNIN
jgi:hypothetical protein